MSVLFPFAWAIFTVTASIGQIIRNTMQRELIATLGTVGATHVRFLFGLPFALCFLALVLFVTQQSLPTLTLEFLLWAALGASTQIAATALMLATMKTKSFVVTTAYIKTESVQLALLGFITLGDRLSLPMIMAILIATAGVMLISWPAKNTKNQPDFNWKPALLGIAAGGLFAFSAIGFRGGIRSLDTPSFVVAASTMLAVGLAMQAISLTLYLVVFDRSVLHNIFKAWKPSIFAGFIGALASQFWFLAFAIETAAKVRTLALIEIFFAQIISGKLFKEKTSPRERMGMALVALGCGLILNV